MPFPARKYDNALRFLKPDEVAFLNELAELEEALRHYRMHAKKLRAKARRDASRAARGKGLGWGHLQRVRGEQGRFTGAIHYEEVR